MKQFHRLTMLGLFAMALLLPAWAARGEEDYSKGMIDRPAALAAANTVTSAKYPDADQVLVDQLRRVSYQADGTYIQWEESWIKILTEKGREENTTLASEFTIPYQRGPEDCKIPLVEIVKADGKVVAIDVAKNSELMIDQSQMSMNIYDPNEKVIRVNVAGLEMGDTLHYVMYDRIVQPRIRDTFCDWLEFEGTSPILHSAVEIQGPASRPLVCQALKDAAGKTVTTAKPVEKDGLISYRWEARDVPRMFPEPDMPSAETVTQRVLVSTAADWPAISRWYWKLSEPHYATTPEMKAKVEELTKGVEGDEQKIHAVFNWVSHEVRYLGITAEAEAPGYEPHDVAACFSRRHGVCRDKAALLTAMLRLAGFDAYPVLIEEGPKKDVEVPQPYFNHAITAVRQKDGSYQLMDSTDEHTRRLLPAYLSNKSYLVATPEGDPLRTSGIVPADENMMHIRTTGRIDAGGVLHATTELKFDGLNDNVYRGAFSHMKLDERRRFFESVLQAVAPGAELTEIEIKPRDMQETGTPLSVRLDFEARDLTVRGGGTVMLPLPLIGHRLGAVNFVLGTAGLKERKYPLVTDTACGVKEEIALELDPTLGTPAALPSSAGVTNDAVLWQAHWTQAGQTLKADGEFQVKKVEYSPKEYGELKETLRLIEQDLRKMPIYLAEKKAAGAGENDIEVINLNIDYDIADAHNWTETRSGEFKVLSYAGKTRFAELKIPFNPAWEEVKFEEGVVTSASGEVKQIGAKEINVMDASEGTAPRYPLEKVLVANFPSVEVGSTVKYRFIRKFKDRPFVAIRETFRGFDPIRSETVRVTAPSKINLRKQEINTELNGKKILSEKPLQIAGECDKWEWTAENVPALQHEDKMPPTWSFAPTIFVSNGDWKRYAGEVYPVLAKSASGQTAAIRKAGELTAGLKDDTARVTAIRDFVAKEVRSAGPGLDGMPLSNITTADRTLADGYGNTSDCAVLLYAMLEASGFHPEFVLASQASRVKELRETQLANPDPALFDEVLVRVKVGKDLVYLNDTDQYAALGATGHDGLTGIVLPSGEFQEIASTGERSNRSQMVYEIMLDKNGDASVRKTTRFYGDGFEAWNRTFSEMRPEDRRRYYQEAVTAISQNAEAVGDLTTVFSSYPGMETFCVRVKKFAVRDGDYLYIRAPLSFSSLFGLRSETRENPLNFVEPKRESVTVELTYPIEFDLVRLPQNLSSKTLGGSVNISSSYKSPLSISMFVRNLSLVYSADIPAALVAPGDYSKLFDLNRQLCGAGAGMILLKRQPAAVPATK